MGLVDRKFSLRDDLLDGKFTGYNYRGKYLYTKALFCFLLSSL